MATPDKKKAKLKRHFQDEPNALTPGDRSPSSAGSNGHSELRALLEPLQPGQELVLTPGAPPVLREGLDIVAMDAKELDAGQIRQLIAPFEEAGGDTVWVNGNTRWFVRLQQSHSGPVAILRALPRSLPSLDDLRLGALQTLSKASGGLVVVAGAPRSGRSTVVGALVAEINRTREARIVTFEMPVNFVHNKERSTIDQRSEFEPTDEAWATADVVVLDPLKPEALETIFQRVNAGALALVTVTALSVQHAVTRLAAMWPGAPRDWDNFMLARLQGIVHVQRVHSQPVWEAFVADPGWSRPLLDENLGNVTSLITSSKDPAMRPLEVSLNALVEQGVLSQEAMESLLRVRDLTLESALTT